MLKTMSKVFMLTMLRTKLKTVLNYRKKHCYIQFFILRHVENNVKNIYVNYVENQIENCFELQKKTLLHSIF